MRRLACIALVSTLAAPAAARPELTPPPSARRATIDRVIAVVGGVVVFASELATQVRWGSADLSATPARKRHALIRKIARKSYEALIERALVEAAGARAGEQVSDAERKTLLDQMDWPSPEATCAAARISREEYDRMLTAMVLEQRLFGRWLQNHPTESAGDSARKKWLRELFRDIPVERRLRF